MTRTTDDNLGLSARAKVAAKIKAPVFVSIHFNGFDAKVQGTETFCHTKHFPQSAALCKAVQAATVGATGLKDRNNGGVKTMALGVLNPDSHHSATACVLVEISFMDVAEEDKRLQTAAYKDKIAAGVASGIGAYIGKLGKEAVAPREVQDGFEALNSGREAASAAAPKKSPGKSKPAASKKGPGKSKPAARG